ncbi:hypothetical protein RB614_26450 [Phytohabitans sp. ZYX-F-186]|uniref:Uncharacterized protein n=1 Tax=Phytohabitans maris TaxID=3071409 RepID=A0ABU0ZLZ9_9ACTN|nr:hypothetical protein [Phytohabitans sp. ZYX-F-186]MDQ7908073.1 hypothetical protein [Phytohabitans sp. ZYX-F-186]
MAGSVSRIRRRYEMAAATPVVVVFAALYAWVVRSAGPSSPDLMLWLLVPFAMPALLWLFTSWLLVHHWWAADGARLSTMDAPGRFLAVAVATLPEPRRRWGQAMLGEMVEVRGGWARWRFALSSARAAVSLLLPAGRLGLAVAAGAVVAAAAHLAVGAVLPGFALFAATFAALAVAVAVLAVGRARSGRPPAPLATALVTAAVAGAVVAAAAFLARHPAAPEGLTPARAIFLAVVLAGCLRLAVAPARRSSGGRLAAYLGAGAAVLLAAGQMVAALAGLGGAALFLLLFGPAFAFGGPAFAAAAARRSFAAGVEAGIWTAITVMPLGCALGLLAAARAYAVDGGWTFAGDATTAGFQVGGAILVLAVTAVLGFPFAAMGATAGALHRGGSLQRRGAQ